MKNNCAFHLYIVIVLIFNYRIFLGLYWYLEALNKWNLNHMDIWNYFMSTWLAKVQEPHYWVPHHSLTVSKFNFKRPTGSTRSSHYEMGVCWNFLEIKFRDNSKKNRCIRCFINKLLDSLRMVLYFEIFLRENQLSESMPLSGDFLDFPVLWGTSAPMGACKCASSTSCTFKK